MKINILSLIVAVFSKFSELSCAGVNIPEGYHVIEDGFLIGVIDEKGISRDLTENYIEYTYRKDQSGILKKTPYASLRTVKYREDEAGNKESVPISLMDFKNMMHNHIVSRRDSRIVIPRGLEIVVDYFIIGTADPKINCYSKVTCKYKQVTRDGVGIKVHVSGAPYEVLAKQDFKKMIEDYKSALAQPSASTRPQLAATQEAKNDHTSAQAKPPTSTRSRVLERQATIKDRQSALAQPSASTRPRSIERQATIKDRQSALAQPSASTGPRSIERQATRKDPKSAQKQPSAST